MSVFHIVDNGLFVATFCMGVLWYRIENNNAAFGTFLACFSYMLLTLSFVGMPTWVPPLPQQVSAIPTWHAVVFGGLLVASILCGRYAGSLGLLGFGVYPFYATLAIHGGFVLTLLVLQSMNDPYVSSVLTVRDMARRPAEGVVAAYLFVGTILGAFVKYKIDGPTRII